MAKKKSTSLPKKNNFLHLYGVLILLCFVAVMQVAQVQNGLSRWRGGGFGMYAEISHLQNKVHVVFLEAPRKIVNPDEIQQKFARHEARIRVFPSDNNCEGLADIVEEETGIRNFEIVTYRPRFDPETMKYSRKKYRKWSNLRRKR